MRIVAATQNKNKLKEIRVITEDFGMELLSQADVGLGDVDVEETGTTCEANSLIKAKTIGKLCGEAVIADDSGLFVDALDGAPGVHSARYCGIHGDDGGNRRLLLDNLADLPFEKRTAKFVTVITLLYPDGKCIVARGECPGHITFEELGDGGFGYDSIFVPDGYGETFAQLDPQIKNRIGHRARALQTLRQLL